MAKKQKTNVMRLLEQAEIEHREYEYDVDDGLIDAKSIARKIGETEEQVFKTLVTQNEKHEYFVFVKKNGSSLKRVGIAVIQTVAARAGVIILADLGARGLRLCVLILFNLTNVLVLMKA